MNFSVKRTPCKSELFHLLPRDRLGRSLSISGSQSPHLENDTIIHSTSFLPWWVRGSHEQRPLEACGILRLDLVFDPESC